MQSFYPFLVFSHLFTISLFQERIKLYCLIPNVSHKEDVKITAPNSVIRTSPNSLSISRIAKSEDGVTRI